MYIKGSNISQMGYKWVWRGLKGSNIYVKIGETKCLYAQVGVIKRLKGSNSGQNGSEGV